MADNLNYLDQVIVQRNAEILRLRTKGGMLAERVRFHADDQSIGLGKELDDACREFEVL